MNSPFRLHRARRAVCTGIAAGLLATGLLAAGTAPAAAEELKLAHFMSPQHPMAAEVMAPLAERVAEASGGDLTIRIFPAGELGSGPAQQYRRAVTGVADITFGIPAYTPEQFPLTGLITFPGMADGPRHGTEVLWSVFDDHLAPEFERVKPLALWTNNPAVLITRDRPVRTLDDMAGLKVRAPDRHAALLLEEWGAVPVSVPATETYSALSSGVVDAVMMGPSGIRSHRLEEIADYVTVGLPSTIASFYLIMNQDAWDGLDPAQRDVLAAETGRELSLEAAGVFAEVGEAALAAMRDAGKTVIELTPEQVAAFEPGAERARSALVADMAGGGEEQAVLEAMAAAGE